ncbi:MAG: hypothetical protein AB1449_04065 [Chloroflexota bacterium]
MPSEAEFNMLVLTRRLRVPGVLETLNDMAPEIRTVMAKITADLGKELNSFQGGGWKINSHSVTIHSGLVIATFLLSRPKTSSPAE